KHFLKLFSNLLSFDWSKAACQSHSTADSHWRSIDGKWYEVPVFGSLHPLHRLVLRSRQNAKYF
ncbi:MAG: hypothetical protein KAZ90_02495, partial [Comamonas sp.]|nr:hypothetical protein [Comamonas sp.]